MIKTDRRKENMAHKAAPKSFINESGLLLTTAVWSGFVVNLITFYYSALE